MPHRSRVPSAPRSRRLPVPPSRGWYVGNGYQSGYRYRAGAASGLAALVTHDLVDHARRWLSPSSTAAHQSGSRTAASSASRGRPPRRPAAGRIAVCSVARRRLLVLDRRLLPLGTDPVEHPSGLAGQQLRSRRTSPPIQPSKADGRPAGHITVVLAAAGRGRAVGSWSIRWSGGQVLPLVGDEGSAMRALGDISSS